MKLLFPFESAPTDSCCMCSFIPWALLRDGGLQAGPPWVASLGSCWVAVSHLGLPASFSPRAFLLLATRY